MKRRACVAVIAASLLSAPSFAAPAASDTNQEGYSFSIIGNGLDRCSAWTLARKTKYAPDAAWVLGYISALNFWFLPKDHGAARNLSEGMTADAVFTEIDTYCDAFPLKQVNDATQSLATRLLAKWHGAHPAIPAKPAARKRPQRAAAQTSTR